MRISLIVAVSENGVIGRDGDMPWHLSSDLKRFKRLTMGHHIIMGRKTFDSLGQLLPGRTTVVVTRQTDFAFSGALVASGIEDAVKLAGNDPEVFIIGGAEIYRLALPSVDRLYLTRIHANIDGDTKFPEVDFTDWKVVEETQQPACDKDDFAHTFQILDRISQPAQN